MCREPFAFSSIHREFIHSVGSLIYLMIPILVILSNTAFYLFFNVKGIFLGELITEETEETPVMWCVVLNVLISLKQS